MKTSQLKNNDDSQGDYQQKEQKVIFASSGSRDT